MASLYQMRVVSKTTGDVSPYWYVSYHQNGKHRSKSAGKSKTVANKLKRRNEAELETGMFDFLNRLENVLICVSVDEFLGFIERLRQVGDVEIPCPPWGCCRTAGDANHDGKYNISDITFGIVRIFAGGERPQCDDEINANGDNSFNIADVTYGIARIFAGGKAPVCGKTGT